MPTVRHVVVEYPTTVFQAGKSDRAALQAAFPQSPTFTMNDEAVYQSFINPPELQNGIIVGSPDFPEGVNKDFTNAPDLTQVQTGGSGLPGLPYAPNPASANEAFVASTIPEMPRETIERIRGAGGFGTGDGTASPNVTAARIVANRRRRLGDNLPMGRSIHV